MHTRRWRTFSIVAVIATCAACTAGPSERPDVAVVESGSGGPAATSTQEQPGPPELEAPITDLRWQDCTGATLAQFGLTPAPAVVVECATFPAPIDSSDEAKGMFDLTATRARLTTTPTDAAPVVYTSGSDRPSRMDVAALGAQPDTALLAAHPVVGVDRRGIGGSAPFDCFGSSTTPDLKQQVTDLGQFTPSAGDAADRVAALGRDATIACTDYLQPDALAFGTADSAADLDALRTAWGVRTIALVGSGNGGSVALAYASAFGDHLSRLVLDAPTSVNTDAVSTAEQTVKGREAAFAAFATRCAASGCSLGPDPRAATLDLVRRAQGGQLAPISAEALLGAVSESLAYGSPADTAARVTDLSNALSAATRGNTAVLQAAVDADQAATGSDGQFVSRCTDGQQWPGTEKVRELEGTWGQAYPLFGSTAALSLSVCAAWPASTPSPLPSEIAVPVLALSGVSDPVTGNDGLSAVTGAISAAGAPVASVTWQGIGHPVSVLSPCARTSVLGYIDRATLPVDGNACPA